MFNIYVMLIKSCIASNLSTKFTEFAGKKIYWKPFLYYIIYILNGRVKRKVRVADPRRL